MSKQCRFLEATKLSRSAQFAMPKSFEVMHERKISLISIFYFIFDKNVQEKKTKIRITIFSHFSTPCAIKMFQIVIKMLGKISTQQVHTWCQKKNCQNEVYSNN